MIERRGQTGGNHVDGDYESGDDEDTSIKDQSGFKTLQLMGTVLCLGTQGMSYNIPHLCNESRETLFQILLVRINLLPCID